MSRKKSPKIEKILEFMIMEAREKAEEIRVLGEEEFANLKQSRISNSRKIIFEAFEKKKLKEAMRKKVELSRLVKKQKVSILKMKDDLLKSLFDKALKLLVKGITGEFLTNLVIEACLMLREGKVRISTNSEHVDKIDVARIKVEVKEKIGLDLSIQVVGDLKNAHGIILFAENDTINVNNTIEARLEDAFVGLNPLMKRILFG